HDDRFRFRSRRLAVRVPRPRIARLIEGDAAAEQQITVRANGETRGLAVLYRVRRFDIAVDVDAFDRAVLHIGSDLRNRDIEPAGSRIPLWLLGAVSRVRKRDALLQGELASAAVDFNERGKRRVVGVIYGKDDGVFRVVGKLVGAIHTTSGDNVRDRVGP